MVPVPSAEETEMFTNESQPQNADSPHSIDSEHRFDISTTRSDIQPANEQLPILCIVTGRDTAIKLVQHCRASSSILCKPIASFNSASKEQFQNVSLSMLGTAEGIDIFVVNLRQDQNAASPMDITFSESGTSVKA
mmetsp:Transcript_4159/g.9753  ORF Transcript_4159/g.9753 Transcript_4159/m.9753 type:complete len:136 (+) Transcript_4159:960-1367(+)